MVSKILSMESVDDLLRPKPHVAEVEPEEDFLHSARFPVLLKRSRRTSLPSTSNLSSTFASSNLSVSLDLVNNESSDDEIDVDIRGNYSSNHLKKERFIKKQFLI